MDAEKSVAFIRNNLPVAVVVSVVTAGIAWSVLHSLYDERLEALHSEKKHLQDEVSVLKEAAERKLEASGATFTAAELQEVSATETEEP